MENLLKYLSILLILNWISSGYVYPQTESKEDWTWVLGSVIYSNKSTVNLLRFSEDTFEIETIEKFYGIANSTSVLSDKNGLLRCFSNHCYVMNSSGDTIIGSSKLANHIQRKHTDCNTAKDWSFDESQLLLPMPDHPDKYVLVYTTEISEWESSPKVLPFSAMVYSAEIDFEKNPNGEITSSWDLLTRDSVSPSCISACYKENGKDWWVINPLDGEPCFSIQEVTSEGIKHVRNQCVGDLTWPIHDLIGLSSFSPDRSKYARYNCKHGLHLYDFDYKTGMLSNPRLIPNVIYLPYGGGFCFSPDSKLLYLFQGMYLYQFNLESSDIWASKILIDSARYRDINGAVTNFNQGRIAPDGKIYISGASYHNSLHCITKPNCLGQECSVIQDYVILPARNYFDVPKMPYFSTTYGKPTSCQSTEISEADKEAINFYPNPTSHYFDMELSALHSPKTFILQDQLGHQIKKWQIPSGIKKYRVQIEDLSNGVYYLTQENHFWNSKIVVIK